VRGPIQSDGPSPRRVGHSGLAIAEVANQMPVRGNARVLASPLSPSSNDRLRRPNPSMDKQRRGVGWSLRAEIQSRTRGEEIASTAPLA
jgi:hypothetical protein